MVKVFNPHFIDEKWKSLSLYSLYVAKPVFKHRSSSTLFMLVSLQHPAKRRVYGAQPEHLGGVLEGRWRDSRKLECASVPRVCPEDQAGHLGFRRTNASWGKREVGAVVGDQTNIYPWIPCNPSPFAQRKWGHTGLNSLAGTMPGYTKLKLRHRKDELLWPQRQSNE